MRTHYDLLGIPPAADADEVKRAFRREIARYHPDKVQHLGTEFQDIAATRAAALTEAYRVLMDAALRRAYDELLAEAPDVHARPGGTSGARPEPASPAGGPAAPPPVDHRFSRAQASTTDFVRRAVMVKLKRAVEALGGTLMSAPAFDLALQITGRRGLFRKPEPTVTLAIRLVSLVDGAAIADAWSPLLRLAAADERLCLMLLGSEVAPARDLGLAVSDLRRKSRKTAPIVVPVDVRDWEALFPPETPPVVRVLLDRLRTGD